MSDLEPQPQQPPPDTSLQPTRPDPWSVWFGRAMQAAGLLIMLFETASTRLFGNPEVGERPWLMLFATGMMIGGIGLNLLLRAVVQRMPG